MNQDVITLRFASEQLKVAEREMASGDLLAARERLALIVAALDRVTYPNG